MTGSRAGPEVHRPRAALSALQHVEAHVGRDAVEPRAQRRAALEAVEAAPRADDRLLDGVLGLERRSEHPVAVAGQLDAVLLELVRDRSRGSIGHTCHASHPTVRRPARRELIAGAARSEAQLAEPALAGARSRRRPSRRRAPRSARRSDHRLGLRVPVALDERRRARAELDRAEPAAVERRRRAPRREPRRRSRERPGCPGAPPSPRPSGAGGRSRAGSGSRRRRRRPRSWAVASVPESTAIQPCRGREPAVRDDGGRAVRRDGDQQVERLLARPRARRAPARRARSSRPPGRRCRARRAAAPSTPSPRDPRSASASAGASPRRARCVSRRPRSRRCSSRCIAHSYGAGGHG